MENNKDTNTTVSSKSRRCRKDIKTIIEGVKAHVTWTEKPKNIVVRGYLINASDGIALDNMPKIRKEAKRKDEIEVVCNQIASTLVDKYIEHSTGPDDHENQVRTHIEEAYYGLLDSNDVISYQWKDVTKDNYMRYFGKNILPYIKDCIYPEDFNRQDLAEMKTELYEKRKKNGNSSNEEEDIQSGIGQRLLQAQTIYDRMRELNPNLPNLTLNDYEWLTTRRQKEQIKFLDYKIHMAFRQLVEDTIDEDPVFARGAALMDSGALRSGEASAVTAGRFYDYGNYAVVWVLGQEQNGIISSETKSDSGYRMVVLDRWGTDVVRRCNAIIGDEKERTSAPLVDTQLSAWVKAILKQSGCTKEFLDCIDAELEEQLRKKYRHDPLQIEKHKDLSAHILRRHRATIWRSFCGFTQWELDYLLGHKNTRKRFEKINPKDDATIRLWAQKVNRYDTEIRDGVQPGAKVFHINKETTENILEFTNYEFINETDKPIMLFIEVEAAEMADEVEVVHPTGMDVEIEAGYRINNQKKRKNNYIIGSLSNLRRDDG